MRSAANPAARCEIGQPFSCPSNHSKISKFPINLALIVAALNRDRRTGEPLQGFQRRVNPPAKMDTLQSLLKPVLDRATGNAKTLHYLFHGLRRFAGEVNHWRSLRVAWLSSFLPRLPRRGFLLPRSVSIFFQERKLSWPRRPVTKVRLRWLGRRIVNVGRVQIRHDIFEHETNRSPAEHIVRNFPSILEPVNTTRRNCEDFRDLLDSQHLRVFVLHRRTLLDNRPLPMAEYGH